MRCCGSLDGRPITVSYTAGEDEGVFSWSVPWAPPIASWSVEGATSQDGPWSAVPSSGSDPQVAFPISLLQTPVPVRVWFRVTPTYSNGVVGSTGIGSVVVPRTWNVPESSEWTLGGATVAMTKADRLAAGLDYWVDGTMGWANSATFAPVGGWVKFTGSGAVDEVLANDVTIDGSPFDYGSGGPILSYELNLLMLYHGEVYIGGDPTLFWSCIALARSEDGGQTWTHVGVLVEPDIAVDSPRLVQPADVGGGTIIAAPDGGQFYIYFAEWEDTGSAQRFVGTGVARFSFADFVLAARFGALPTTTKLSATGWDQPGLGGLARCVFGENEPSGRWSYAFRVGDRVAIIASDGIYGNWTYLIRESDDGVTWSEAAAIPTGAGNREALYVSITDRNLNPLTGEGPAPANTTDFWLWRTTSDQYEFNRWAGDARLERCPLTRSG